MKWKHLWRENIGFRKAAVAVVFGAALTVAGPAWADVPASLTHQGRLLDDDGNPVTGPTTLRFALYDAANGGATLWESEVSADLDDSGFFSVDLGGMSNPIDATILEDGNVWLGLSVNGSDELSPRIKLNSVPFAVRAGQADSVAPGAITNEAIANGAVSGEKIAAVPWQKIMNVPADLTDGDDDTLAALSCASGQFPHFNAGQWSCGTLPDNYVSTEQSCPAGQMVVGFDVSGDVLCDAPTTYDGTDFALADQSCPVGQFAVGISATGHVTCDELPEIPTYDGTDFAVSNQACPPGQAASGIDANGNVECVQAGDNWVPGGLTGAIVSSFGIRAKSDCGNVALILRMEVFVNQRNVGGWDVGNSSYADFTVNLPEPTYVNEIAVAFTNDSSAGNCDHNLYVESITLDNGTTIPATDSRQAIYDRDDFFDMVNVMAGRAELNWNGALRFFLAPTPPATRKVLVRDYMRSDSDLRGTSSWQYASLDGKAGPFTVRTSGRPVRVYFKTEAYLYANTSHVNDRAGLIIHPVIDGVQQDYCTYQYVRGWGTHDDMHVTVVCDFVADLTPGEHTIGFEHRHHGYRTVLYGNNKRSLILIEEL